ncbi:MAG: PEP-CTERM sorting domain-containing protein [Nitrospirota bacterium]
METINYKLTELSRGVKMKRIFYVIGLLALLFTPLLSEALPVPIENYSFEAIVLGDGSSSPGITGWTTSLGPTSWGAGVYNPRVSNYGTGVTIPDGSNVAYINNNGAYISQIISDYFITADTLLTLSVDVGWRLDGLSGEPLYGIQLLSNGTILNSGFSSLVQGSFVTASISYLVGADNSFIGQPLEIRFTKIGNSSVQFDNVRLENDHTSAAVPEPSTLLLLGAGLLGFGIFARKRKK